jgi:hypothetical protein
MQNRILLVEDVEELRQLKTQTHFIHGLGYSYRGGM